MKGEIGGDTRIKREKDVLMTREKEMERSKIFPGW